MKTVSGLALAPGRGERGLYALAAKKLGVRPGEIEELQIKRRSLDARRKGAIKFVYTVDVRLRGEPAEPPERPTVYRAFPPKARRRWSPASARRECSARSRSPARGLRPIVLERGADVDTRAARVAAFRAGGALDSECNVQFGEGGAGTFSDGKLNTGTHDRRNFARFA